MEPSSLESTFARFATTRDARALADVFDATAPELTRVARHLTRDEAEAEDVVQGTFLEAMEHAERFDASRPLLPWLVGILEHQAHDARRRSQRCLDALRVARERPRDASVEASSREFFASLARAVHDLPEPYRVVLAPHIDGRTSPEIGKELGLEDGTVRVRIHRGLVLLRKLLPPGFLAGALFVELSPRGLAAVRDTLTASAVAAGAAGTASASTLAAAGGWIVVNKLVFGAAALVIVGAAWFLRQDEATTRSTVASDPSAQVSREAQSNADPSEVVAARPDATKATPPVVDRVAVNTPEPPDAHWSRGLVRHAIDLTPIEGAAVHGMMWERVTSRDDFHAVSRADGSFDIPASFVRDDRLQGMIVATAPGFARGRDSTTSVDPQPFVADLRLQPECAIEGRVALEDGTAVTGATIEVFDELGPWLGRLTTTTDARGDYRIAGFEPGRADGIPVRAMDTNGRTLAIEVAQTPKGEVRVRCDIVVRPARAIDVVVCAQRGGSAIADAEVVIFGVFRATSFASRIADYPFARRGRTSNDGRLRIDDLFGHAIDVFAVAPGFAPAHRRLEGTALAATEVIVSLQTGAIAAGVLLRADGSPCPGEPLRIETEVTPKMDAFFVESPFAPVWRLDDDAWPRNPFRLTTTTGDDGRFRFECVPAQKTARIVIGTAKPGAKQDVFGPLVLAPGDEKTSLVVRLVRAKSIAGVVVDEAGEPVPDASLTASPAPSTPRDALRLTNWFTNGTTCWPGTSAANGSFTIDGIHDLPLDLRVQGEGFASVTLREIAVGTRDVRVVMTRSPP